MSIFLIQLGGKEVLFSHVPKTGGTSIRKGRQVSPAWFTNPPARFRRHPCFAFVRDPLDRAISAWQDFTYLRDARYKPPGGLLQTLLAYQSGKLDDVTDYRTLAHHMSPQTHTIHGLQHAQWIGRFERYKEDWKQVCRWLEIPLVQCRHIRKSSNHPRPSVNVEVLRLVAEIYAEDYQRLGYPPP